jgi:hypothetical protein
VSNYKIIVTFDQLSKTLWATENAGKSETAEVLDKTGATPEEQAAIMAGLNTAQMKLKEEEAKGVPGVLVSPDHRFTSLIQTFLAEQAAKDSADGKSKLAPLPTGGLEAKFDDRDWVRWFGSFLGWWRLHGKGPHAWISAPSPVKEFPANTKMALFGDWGTGLYGAPECSRSIERGQAQYLSQNKTGYGLVLHLGDVYYAGSDDEMQKGLLDVWPKIDGAINRTCNSNHEMYTGGQAYFDKTLKDERFKDQKASYFALENQHWILAGLDSAYHAPDWRYNKAALSDDQIAWLRNLVDSAAGRKVVLFSHHQPFSFFDGQNTAFTNKLGDILLSKKIFAWYWGHEHRCILYDRHPLWNFYGRCVGHGGYPYFRDDLAGAQEIAKSKNNTRWVKMRPVPTLPEGRILDGPNPYVEGHENKYGTQGYMTLDFDGDTLRELVHTPDGEVILENEVRGD